MRGMSSQSGQGNEQPVERKKEPRIWFPWMNGIYAGVDAFGAVNHLLGSDFLSAEGFAGVNLKNRYFPTIEAGFGRMDATGDLGIHYKTSAPYVRVGADYNFLYNKQHGHMVLAGFRLAATNFTYDINQTDQEVPTTLTDGYWGDQIDFVHPGMDGSMKWLEINFGLRTRISKRIDMGWTIRYKRRLSAQAGEYGDPFYVPGFGKYGSTTIGLTYNLIFKIVSPKSKPHTLPK